jgi:hypothetical protein
MTEQNISYPLPLAAASPSPCEHLPELEIHDVTVVDELTMPSSPPT